MKFIHLALMNKKNDTLSLVCTAASLRKEEASDRSQRRAIVQKLGQTRRKSSLAPLSVRCGAWSIASFHVPILSFLRRSFFRQFARGPTLSLLLGGQGGGGGLLAGCRREPKLCVLDASARYAPALRSIAAQTKEHRSESRSPRRELHSGGFQRRNPIARYDRPGVRHCLSGNGWRL